MIKYTCEDNSPTVHISIEGDVRQLAYETMMLIKAIKNNIQEEIPEETERYLAILKKIIDKEIESLPKVDDGTMKTTKNG